MKPVFLYLQLVAVTSSTQDDTVTSSLYGCHASILMNALSLGRRIPLVWDANLRPCMAPLDSSFLHHLVCNFGKHHRAEGTGEWGWNKRALIETDGPWQKLGSLIPRKYFTAAWGNVSSLKKKKEEGWINPFVDEFIQTDTLRWIQDIKEEFRIKMRLQATLNHYLRFTVEFRLNNFPVTTRDIRDHPHLSINTASKLTRRKVQTFHRHRCTLFVG